MASLVPPLEVSPRPGPKQRLHEQVAQLLRQGSQPPPPLRLREQPRSALSRAAPPELARDFTPLELSRLRLCFARWDAGGAGCLDWGQLGRAIAEIARVPLHVGRGRGCMFHDEFYALFCAPRL